MKRSRPRMRPWGIRNLTLPELALALDQDIEGPPRPPPGSRVFRSAEERDEYVRQLRAMTSLERLRRAREE